MFVHEAIRATTSQKPYIRRKSWGYVTTKPMVPVKILPTNSPDGCVIHSIAEKNPFRGWQPTAGDLIAEDWEAVGL